MAVLRTVPRLKPAMCSSTCVGVQPGSGSVTLKKASLARCSKGPGMSIEAKVSARMKGGVSSSTGASRLGCEPEHAVTRTPAATAASNPLRFAMDRKLPQPAPGVRQESEAELALGAAPRVLPEAG